MAENTSTGYMWQERFAWHDTGTHTGIFPSGGYSQPHQAFESSESKSRFAGLVEVSGLGDKLTRVNARMASDDEILRVHTTEYLQHLQAASDSHGGDAGDGATPFGKGSLDIARLAVGGAMNAADAVFQGEVENAYALTRPPGHHAEPDLGRGYCLLSNVGITIEHVRKKFDVERIAIVDYDVHHGNGAQKIFWEDPGVLHISLHQHQLFPLESGELSEIGAGKGEGFNINVPLPSGTGNGGYLAAIDRVAAPAIEAYKPDAIFVSSGFDPSALDPLGCMSVTSGGFRAIATRLKELARSVCGGRLVMFHEGGYSPVAVPFCGLAVLEAMSGISTEVVDPFGQSFDTSPAHELLPHQERVIDLAAQIYPR